MHLVPFVCFAIFSSFAPELASSSVLDVEVSLKYLGYSVTDPDISHISVVTNEISGLVWYENNIFYGISDTTGVPNKGWIEYSYDYSSYGMTALSGTALNNTPSMYGDKIDSESIAFVTVPAPFLDNNDDDFFNSSQELDSTDSTDLSTTYVVVAKEGDREQDTTGAILLFDMEGHYIKKFTYPKKYDMNSNSGFQNNGGFEGLDIQVVDRNHASRPLMTFVNEKALIQDKDVGCVACLRISVGPFRLNASLPAASGVVFLSGSSHSYTLRYDADVEPGPAGGIWRVTDLILLNATRLARGQAYQGLDVSQVPTLPALLLEGWYNGTVNKRRMYMVDLQLDRNNASEVEMYDIYKCKTIGNLSDDCADKPAIEKKLVWSLEDAAEKGQIPQEDYKYLSMLNFEAIAVMPGLEDEYGCVDRMVMVNDDGDSTQFNNSWVSFDLDFCQLVPLEATKVNETKIVVPEGKGDDDDAFYENLGLPFFVGCLSVVLCVILGCCLYARHVRKKRQRARETVEVPPIEKPLSAGWRRYGRSRRNRRGQGFQFVGQDDDDDSDNEIEMP